MTTIPGASTLTQTLYQALFDRLNTDGDDVLTVGEIGASGSQKVHFESVFKALDADADGRVVRSEMASASRFGSEALNTLISAQATTTEARTDTEIVADLFVRADVDGDGALSVAEMQAERDLRRAANLDAGQISGPIFAARDADGDGLLKPDEIGVGRLIDIPLSSIRFHDEGPDSRIKLVEGAEPQSALTAEQKQARLDQLAADRAERASGPAGTVRFLSREIDDLRKTAMDAFASRAMSQTLADRLLRQIAGGGTFA